MPGNSFGTLFKFMTYGESHGPAIGVVIDGVPSNIPLTESDIQFDLDRRRPGQSDITTPRQELDKVEILSGVFEGKTTGVPISLMIRNQDQQSKDYSAIEKTFRPGHADHTYHHKYGIRDHRGGGRSSGRETACRVAAGAIAKKMLQTRGISVHAFTQQVGDVVGTTCDYNQIESNAVRAADPVAAEKMIKLIQMHRDQGDSIGGIVECHIKGCFVGLGEPLYDKLDAVLSHALMSIGTIKGISFGAGFDVATMTGFENNDVYTMKDGQARSETNHAGGITGGLSNGEDIIMRLAVKPPSSITKEQRSVTTTGEETTLQVHGRHDPCICPRVIPVAEAMCAVTMADMLLQYDAYH